MILIKTLLSANRSERDKFSIPRSAQRSIPIRRIYPDGIWLAGRKHTRAWRFTDINYASASQEDQESIFRAYGALLNALSLCPCAGTAWTATGRSTTVSSPRGPLTATT